MSHEDVRIPKTFNVFNIFDFFFRKKLNQLFIKVIF